MTLARTWAVALDGVSGHLVQVEADLANGLPGTTVIGLGDQAVCQARERVRAAIVNSGQRWPERRITISLSPAALPKRGAGFDLAMAVAVLEAAKVIGSAAASALLLIGELGLDGTLRPVRGVLPLLLAAKHDGPPAAIVPPENLAEAALSGLQVRAARTLAEVICYLRGESSALIEPGPVGSAPAVTEPDLADVVGQGAARLALEVAAAGGHHLAMTGPPGSGKTMLAARLPGLLPPLAEEQALEVTAVHSVAGLLDDHLPLVRRPPFVDPHHSASVAAIIGGGSGHIRPGCVSLAHGGVLFLDEAPEFRVGVLDSLRQALEAGSVAIARARGVVRYPARFQLVLAANPCQCQALDEVACTCPPGTRRRYLARLSGPLLDRIDIRIQVDRVDPIALAVSSPLPVEGSAVVAARVARARARAAARWHRSPWQVNGHVPGPQIRAYWRHLGADAGLLDRPLRRGELSARGYDRVLRLALTLADLAGRDKPESGDLGQALALRTQEG